MSQQNIPSAAERARLRRKLIKKVEAIHQIYGEYELLEEISGLVDDLRRRDHRSSQGSGMLLIGPSGAGKTTFVEHYFSRFKRKLKAIVLENGDSADRVPVVLVKVRNSTLKYFTEATYQALVGIEPPPENQYRMTDLIIEKAVDMQVQLFIFDESHQAIQGRDESVVNNFSIFFKDLLNAKRFAILIVGTRDARRYLTVNEELDGRIPIKRELGAFAWDNMIQRGYFLAFLKQFDEHFVPILGGLSGLAEPDMAVRIHAGSGALLRGISMLLEQAGKYAVDDLLAGCEGRITIQHLARAYEDRQRDKGGPNPFLVENPVPYMPVLESEEEPPKSTRRSNKDHRFRP